VLLFVFGCIVVIGLIGEYSPKYQARVRVFEVLVTVGVAGEVLAGALIAASSHQLQMYSDLEVGRLNKEAASFRLKAEILGKENVRARTDLANINAQTKSTEERTSANIREIFKLKKEAAEAQQKQAQAELQLKHVSERQAQRRVEIPKFRAALNGKPKGKAQIMYLPNDGEAYNFAWSIEIALFGSGWIVASPIPIPPDGTGEGMRELPLDMLRRFPPTFRLGSALSRVASVSSASTKMAAERFAPLRSEPTRSARLRSVKRRYSPRILALCKLTTTSVCARHAFHTLGPFRSISRCSGLATH